MKEASGELNMTVITIVAIAVIAGIMAALWGPIRTWIQNSFGGEAADAACPPGQTWNGTECVS